MRPATMYGLATKPSSPSKSRVGTTWKVGLEIPAAFLPLYHQKPITPGESVEAYDALFQAMAGEACPRSIQDFVELKLEVDAIWRAQHLARLSNALCATAAQSVLEDDIKDLVYPSTRDHGEARRRAQHEVTRLRRFGTPTTLHVVEGSVDMDMAQMRGLAQRAQLFQMLNTCRMAERGMALRLKREREGRQYEQGACVPITIVAIAPKLKLRPAKTRSQAAIVPAELGSSIRVVVDPTSVSSFAPEPSDSVTQDAASAVLKVELEGEGPSGEAQACPGGRRGQGGDETLAKPEEADNAALMAAIASDASSPTFSDWLRGVLKGTSLDGAARVETEPSTQIRWSAPALKSASTGEGYATETAFALPNPCDPLIDLPTALERRPNETKNQYWFRYDRLRMKRIDMMSDLPPGVDRSRMIQYFADEWVAAQWREALPDERRDAAFQVKLKRQRQNLLGLNYFGEPDG